ncbi:nucleotide-diphospho-sugar transferase [Spirosoma koreense]
MSNLIESKTRYSFDVPILFVMFNRPEHARQVMNRIRQIQPAQLFIAIDGPRTGIKRDNEGVQQCIKLLDEIDWPCKIEKLIRTQNLGCKKAVSSAIDWFFENVEYGIILEDDCLPDITFFEFCRILLLKYVDEPKIMHIGGTNLYGNLTWGSYSYFFSKIAHVWGWATWRRAWSLYDVEMKDYDTYRKTGGINETVIYRPSLSYWKFSFDNTRSGIIDTWDYQWVFAIWKNQGFTIIPNQNLISNTGFGPNATHTVTDSVWSSLPTVAIDTQFMKFPKEIELDTVALKYAFAHFYRLPSWWLIKLNRVRRLVSTLLVKMGLIKTL